MIEFFQAEGNIPSFKDCSIIIAKGIASSKDSFLIIKFDSPKMSADL